MNSLGCLVVGNVLRHSNTNGSVIGWQRQRAFNIKQILRVVGSIATVAKGVQPDNELTNFYSLIPQLYICGKWHAIAAIMQFFIKYFYISRVRGNTCDIGSKFVYRNFSTEVLR